MCGYWEAPLGIKENQCHQEELGFSEGPQGKEKCSMKWTKALGRIACGITHVRGNIVGV